MIVFWIAVGVISTAVAGLILGRAAQAAAAPQGSDSTLPLYRRQLAEIDELADRGLIAADERRSAHAEAARRLLSAAETTESGWTPGPERRRGVVLLAGLAPLAALALYFVVGSPGYGDQPQAQRLAQWRAMPPRVCASSTQYSMNCEGCSTASHSTPLMPATGPSSTWVSMCCRPCPNSWKNVTQFE